MGFAHTTFPELDLIAERWPDQAGKEATPSTTAARAEMPPPVVKAHFGLRAPTLPVPILVAGAFAVLLRFCPNIGHCGGPEPPAACAPAVGVTTMALVAVASAKTASQGRHPRVVRACLKVGLRPIGRTAAARGCGPRIRPHAGAQ